MAIPEDVLYKEIFGRLPQSYSVAVLWGVSRRCHTEARALLVHPLQHPLVVFAAGGYLRLLAWAQEYYYGGMFPDAAVEFIFAHAARRGRENVCRQMHAWYPHHYLGSMLTGAAAGGHIPLCRLVKDWGEQVSTADAMKCAAEGGHREVCVLFKEWRGTLSDFDGMLEGAALGGHAALCRLAREWGATNFRAMHAAAKLRTGNPSDEARNLANDWWVEQNPFTGRGLLQLIAGDDSPNRMFLATDILNRRLFEIVALKRAKEHTELVRTLTFADDMDDDN
jgi:hypothetical protein